MATKCPLCAGVGSYQIGKGSIPCPRCGGSGRDHTSDPAEINYTARLIAEQQRGEKPHA